MSIGSSLIFPAQRSAGTSARTTEVPLGPRRLTRSLESCIVAASLFFTVFANQRFWSAWAGAHDWSMGSTWLMAALAAVLLTAIHCLILGLLLFRPIAKPVLGLLFVVTALAVHFMNRYTVYFDAGMIRNVLHTDVSEASELLTAGMLADVFVRGAIPALLLSRIEFRARPMRQALPARMLFLAVTAAIAAACLLASFQDLSALMRNQKTLRYLITPASLIVSSLRVVAAETDEAKQPRIPVGKDAVAASRPAGSKPRLLVLVVGETVRAANWGLNGYVRQTTPELASAGVINFPHVTSCGTNTEVSVPCMFSPFGRRAYDEKQIRRHESVLHVLEHAGIKTIWRDNQSGCKGVCDGLESQRPGDARDPALCAGEHCMDEILLSGLEQELARNRGDLVIVMHQLGNHGPAYSHRYPAAYRRYTPTCDDADLGKCSREQIVNSYDNAVLYTDHFLATAIRRLQAQTSHDAALLYVSDHGESLGENGVYLHGLPHAIAPHEQSQVPMVMWLSAGFSGASRIDTNCMRTHAGEPASHDNLFHSMLGLMQVQTIAYTAAFDLTKQCRVRPGHGE